MACKKSRIIDRGKKACLEFRIHRGFFMTYFSAGFQKCWQNAVPSLSCLSLGGWTTYEAQGDTRTCPFTNNFT